MTGESGQRGSEGGREKGEFRNEWARGGRRSGREAVAQYVQRRVVSREVRGSSPVSGSAQHSSVSPFGRRFGTFWTSSAGARLFTSAAESRGISEIVESRGLHGLTGNPLSSDGNFGHL